MTITGNITDIYNREIYLGSLSFQDKTITAVKKLGTEDPSAHYIVPGFIDAHVHIESSMVVPSEFARLAVVHGTVATVSDPHEIANVCGVEGVDFMIANGSAVNFKFNFGAPSCVPATTFETSGDALPSSVVQKLLEREDIRYLSEMMNYPGVINSDTEVMQKIACAHQRGKPVDGHAPALRGDALKTYVNAGISTDHECFTAAEALEKLGLGMKILIREGSAAKNFEALVDLLNDFPDQIMFCSDDKHPDSLVNSHINELCARAIKKNIPVFNVLQAACINPVKHYALDVGTLRVGEPADFIVVENLSAFKTISTYINGSCVAHKGKTLLLSQPVKPVNKFVCKPVEPEQIECLAIDYLSNQKLPVIEAVDGQLITNKLLLSPTIKDKQIVTDTGNDILKIIIINRYQQAPAAISFVRNFGLKSGAIASSVAHDSHNIIAVGVEDKFICDAVNLIIAQRGGISCAAANFSDVLPLEVAGLMSAQDGYKVAEAYTRLDAAAKSLGSGLSAPFMTLSFMALLVIPSVKLSDKGLFDGERFSFVYGG